MLYPMVGGIVMAEIIFIFIFTIPAILGLAEILHTVRILFVSTHKIERSILIIVPNNENFSKQLIYTAEQYRWHGNRYAERIVVLDYLLNEENKQECALLARKFNFQICSKTELAEKFF